MRASLVKSVAFLGIACASGILFVACANGTDGSVSPNATDDSGGGGGGDATTGGKDGSTFGGDSGSSDSGPDDAGVDSGPTCIDDDAGCSTGNPGLCADGNHHCEADGGSVCVPLYTTQSCYTGGATTRDKGICHDGTQSCIGSVGTCTGDQLPDAHENCFDTLDNDCDGFVNNGCPVSIVMGTPRNLTAQGGGGGAPGTVICPANEFVSRADFYFDHYDTGHASGIEIICAAATLHTDASSYSVTLAIDGTSDESILGANTTSDDENATCGIAGLTGLAWIDGVSDNTFVEGFNGFCGQGTMTLNTDNTLSFSFANNPLDGGYLYYAHTNNVFFEDLCASNELIVGFNVHSGLWMDNIQPICAPMQATYSAGTPDP